MSIGSTTLLCAKCQEDILNSNRLLSSHRQASEQASDLQQYQKHIDPYFFNRAQSIADNRDPFTRSEMTAGPQQLEPEGESDN